MIKYSLIIPFYNEAKNIPEVMLSLKFISKKINSIEFILVNNGSTDSSHNILEKVLKTKNKKYIDFLKKKILVMGMVLNMD